MDTLTLVVSAVVALQAMQTFQVSILRRDVRRTLSPPPNSRCVICGEAFGRVCAACATRGGPPPR